MDNTSPDDGDLRPTAPLELPPKPSAASTMERDQTFVARFGRWLARVGSMRLPRLDPSRLGLQIDWRLDGSVARRSFVAAFLILYAVVSVWGLARAYTIDGPCEDRTTELSRLRQQLTEEQAHTVRLQSELDAFDRRREVRISVIREELGMLRPNERFVRFK